MRIIEAELALADLLTVRLAAACRAAALGRHDRIDCCCSLDEARLDCSGKGGFVGAAPKSGRVVGRQGRE